jgi:hypothetical protein
MDDYLWGLAAGIAVGVMIVAIVKWRRRHMPPSVPEQAEYLSKRRVRMLPMLAVILVAQQAAVFTSQHDPLRGVDHVKIAGWLILATVMLLALFTGGFWFYPRAVRDLLDDETTRAHRQQAISTGFLFSMIAAIGLYILSLFEAVGGREAVHVVMTFGIGAALVRWGLLERRAHGDA